MLKKIINITAVTIAMLFAIVGCSETNSVIINWTAFAGMVGAIIIAYYTNED